MTSLTLVRERSITLMRRTMDTLTNIISGLSQETVTTLRDLNDGDKGWTVLEVLCHLRDFDEIFYNRAVMMLEHDHPQLPFYDHEALAIENDYNHQDHLAVLADLQEKRARFILFWEDLGEEQWDRTGIHPERESFNMTDAVMQVGHHDANHLEQITRILSQ